MNGKTLSGNLLSLMKKRKVTISELSDATGVAEITINKLRNGHNTNPTLSTVVQIADYFSVTVTELLSSHTKSLLILNEDGTKTAQRLQVEELSNNAEFAIKITHSNYSIFQKNTILLINSQIKVKSGDYIVVKSGNNYIVCRAIIEPGVILGESLNRKENIYKIDSDNLSGVVTGALWLRN